MNDFTQEELAILEVAMYNFLKYDLTNKDVSRVIRDKIESMTDKNSQYAEKGVITGPYLSGRTPIECSECSAVYYRGFHKDE